MKVSILIPVFNEEENLALLAKELLQVVNGQPWQAELIFIDDGSTDRSPQILQELAQKEERCRVLTFSRNFGQTAAMQAGFEHATGEVVIPMDADLQNDPADIPRLLAKLEEGYDVVSGWRKVRQDKWLSRRFPSILANRLISWWTGVKLHDYGCTLKAYRSSVLKGTRLYGEMHRFIPVYATWRGARVVEMAVNHRPRRYGKSKYGLGRTFKVLLDMLTVKLLGSYSTKPIYLFGGLGVLFAFLGLLTFTGVALEKILIDQWPHKMTMLLFSTLLCTVGVLLIMMGLLAELMVRIYHEAQNKPIYLLQSDLHPTTPSPPSGPAQQEDNEVTQPELDPTPTAQSGQGG
ncbi:MAG: glycosyltransferase family 2 protein [Bradymonadales bacterium]|nr:glycosyltransferase family 2 protein [Bradymonadales bacterium]